MATKSHILSRGPPTTCHHCSQTLTIDHMLLECAVLRESRDEYYTADSLNTLFETILDTCIVEFLREAGFFYLIWTVRHSIQSLTWTIHKLKQFFIFMYTISDMNGHISSTTPDLNELATDKILNLATPPDLFVEDKQIWENPTCEGWLIHPEECVSSLNKSNPIQFTCIVEFLREAGFFYLIWCNSLTSTSPQMWTMWSDLSNRLRNESNSETHLLVEDVSYVLKDMCRR